MPSILIAMLFRIVASIVVPYAYRHDLEESKEIRGKKNGDRSLIIAETMERYERNRLLSRSTLCIGNFLRDRSISFRYSTTVLLSNFGSFERQTSAEIDLLVYILQVETTTYTRDNLYGKDCNGNVTSTVIIAVVENSGDIEKTNYTYRKMCSYECEYVIMMARIFDNEESFLREADTLQRSIWSSKSIGKLVVLGSTRETVLLAGSSSFEPEDLCIPSAPVLLGSCSTDLSSIKQNTIWRFEAGPIGGRELSMNGCTLVVAYYDHPPYSFTINETRNERILGLEGFMIEEILYSMNARLTRELINTFSSNESAADDFRMTTEKGPVDLLIGGLLWNPDEETDYTMAYDMVPLVWMTPVKANVSLRGLVAPFSIFVWLAIICVIFLGVFIRLLVIKDVSLLDVLALLLGVSVHRQPEHPSSRILFLGWSLFGFFISQYYLASLADQLVNVSNLQIETMKELLSSGLELGGTSQYADFFDEIEKKDDDVEESLVIRSIREKFHTLLYENYVQRLSDLLNGKDQNMALIVKLNLSNSQLNLPKQYVHAMRENMGNHPLAIATWKGFPCLRKINIKMQGLIEAGIIEYWARLITLNGSYYHSKDNTNSDSDIDLESVVPGFLLLIIGYLIGFLMLIIEIIVYPIK